MLKKRELNGYECHTLFDLMSHPDVFPFVRQKAASYDEFLFLTKQTIEAEERGELISRTILDEWENPIGTISLYDIDNRAGFLGTWIGKPYHGKGYNHSAKEAFFQEVFFEKDIETIYMRIRNENIRSIRAAEKLPYTVKANDLRPRLFEQLNKHEYVYDIYEIPKDIYTMNCLRQQAIASTLNEPLEA